MDKHTLRTLIRRSDQAMVLAMMQHFEIGHSTARTAALTEASQYAIVGDRLRALLQEPTDDR